MNLWIRSQDKMKMLPNPKLAIIISGDVENGYSFDIYDISSYNQEVNLRYGYLGTYETKERALEVLDDIQDVLMPKIKVLQSVNAENNIDDLVFRPTIQECGKVELLQYSDYVYEMPKG